MYKTRSTNGQERTISQATLEELRSLPSVMWLALGYDQAALAALLAQVKRPVGGPAY
jgi:hypothetical protein